MAFALSVRFSFPSVGQINELEGFKRN